MEHSYSYPGPSVEASSLPAADDRGAPLLPETAENSLFSFSYHDAEPDEMQNYIYGPVSASCAVNSVTLPPLGETLAATPCPRCNSKTAWNWEFGCQDCAANMAYNSSLGQQSSGYQPSAFAGYSAVVSQPGSVTWLQPSAAAFDTCRQLEHSTYSISATDIHEAALRDILNWWFPGRAALVWQCHEVLHPAIFHYHAIS